MYDKIAQKLIKDLNLPSEIFDIEYEGLKTTSKDDKNTFYELIGNLAQDFKGHYYVNHFKENRESIVLLINAADIKPYIESINEVLAENNVDIFENGLEEPTFRHDGDTIFLGVVPKGERFEIHLTRKVVTEI